jgi:hypothetical protein
MFKMAMTKAKVKTPGVLVVTANSSRVLRQKLSGRIIVCWYFVGVLAAWHERVLTSPSTGEQLVVRDWEKLQQMAA